MIQVPLNKILYLDIETAPIVEDFMHLPDRLGDIWMQKHVDDGSPSLSFREKAGLHAEFAKVVCVGLGYFYNEPEQKEQKFKVMSLTGSEEEILTQLEGILDKLKGYYLCGHAYKGFDGPFLAKRYLINGMSLPSKLDNSGKKPWEVSDLDTYELWKFGSFTSKSASLDLLCAVFGIDSPKEEMDGSMVGQAFYEGKIDAIARYCKSDVIALARLTQRLVGLNAVSNENIAWV